MNYLQLGVSDRKFWNAAIEAKPRKVRFAQKSPTLTDQRINSISTKLAVEILVGFQYRNPYTMLDKQKCEHHPRRPASDDATVWLKMSSAVVWGSRLIIRHKHLQFAATNRNGLPIIGPFALSLSRAETEAVSKNGCRSSQVSGRSALNPVIRPTC